MNYTSIIFLPFFFITIAAYYLVGNLRWQLLVLIIASLFFYAWESPPLLAIFLSSWLITGLSSYFILTADNPFKAKLFSTAGVTINLLLLGFFTVYGLNAATALPLWACFAITLVIAAVGGGLLLAGSMNSLRETNWLPHETLDSLKENVTWIKKTLENETSSTK